MNNPSFTINIYEAKNEKANVNDIELCLEIEPDKYIILVIQSKKLYFTTQKYHSISHKISGKYQIDLFEQYAKKEKAIPLYMLYNYSPDLKIKNNQYYGCTLIYSKIIRDNYYLKNSGRRCKIPTFDDLHQIHHSVPFHTLASNVIKLKKIVDKYHKSSYSYDIFTKNELTDNNKWIKVFEKSNQDFSNYISDEFEPKYKIILGLDK